MSATDCLVDIQRKASSCVSGLLWRHLINDWCPFLTGFCPTRQSVKTFIGALGCGWNRTAIGLVDSMWTRSDHIPPLLANRTTTVLMCCLCVHATRNMVVVPCLKAAVGIGEIWIQWLLQSLVTLQVHRAVKAVHAHHGFNWNAQKTISFMLQWPLAQTCPSRCFTSDENTQTVCCQAAKPAKNIVPVRQKRPTVAELSFAHSFHKR